MSSTRTQSQLCTATPISSFVQCHISFRLLPSSVATFVLIETNICIVQNNKLRKLLCKGLKYREPVSINFSICKTKIKKCLTVFSSDWYNKKGVIVKCFTQRISLAMEKVNKKHQRTCNINLNLTRLNKC